MSNFSPRLLTDREFAGFCDLAAVSMDGVPL
jgi:hypothetical protein